MVVQSLRNKSEQKDETSGRETIPHPTADTTLLPVGAQYVPEEWIGSIAPGEVVLCDFSAGLDGRPSSPLVLPSHCP